MTRDDIIEMARQVGFLTHPKNTYIISKHASADEDLSDELEAFAKLVAEKEREACAKVCEDNATDLSEGDWDSACNNCADHIRAREQQ